MSLKWKSFRANEGNLPCADSLLCHSVGLYGHARRSQTHETPIILASRLDFESHTMARSHSCLWPVFSLRSAVHVKSRGLCDDFSRKSIQSHLAHIYQLYIIAYVLFICRARTYSCPFELRHTSSSLPRSSAPRPLLTLPCASTAGYELHPFLIYRYG